MTGAHDHPDMTAVVAGLLERVAALVVALDSLPGGGPVPGHREYSGKVEDRVVMPVDGKWVDVPGFPAFTGSPFNVPDETHSIYLRLYPEWPKDTAAPLTVEVRYVRATGDATAHDMAQFAPATNSIPFRAYHDEFGEKDVGGMWQLRLSGGPTSVELSTRYGKLRSFDTRWT